MDPIHFSNLKFMGTSPAHYHYAATHRRTPTRAMLVGTMTHALVLGTDPPPVFDGDRRSKAWREFQAEYPAGTDILTASEADDARRIADAVLANEHARRLLEGAQTEALRLWRFCDRECSSRLDFLRPDLIGELKVSNSADPRRFEHLSARMSYHAQLAFYNLAVGRTEDSPAYVIVAEDKPPHPVTVFEADQDLLRMGARQCRLWMEALLVCEQADCWPAYAQSVVPLRLPDWAGDGEDEETELMIDGEAVAL